MYKEQEEVEQFIIQNSGHDDTFNVSPLLLSKSQKSFNYVKESYKNLLISGLLLCVVFLITTKEDYSEDYSYGINLTASDKISVTNLIKYDNKMVDSFFSLMNDNQNRSIEDFFNVMYTSEILSSHERISSILISEPTDGIISILEKVQNNNNNTNDDNNNNNRKRLQNLQTFILSHRIEKINNDFMESPYYSKNGYRNNVFGDNNLTSNINIKSNVTLHGHRHCNLLRDNWKCSGDRYLERLRESPVLHKLGIGVETLPKNTQLYLEGNSFLAQLIYSWVCNSNLEEIELYTIAKGNNLYVYHKEKNISIFMIDNDVVFTKMSNFTETIVDAMKMFKFDPNMVILGQINNLNDQVNLCSQVMRESFMKSHEIETDKPFKICDQIRYEIYSKAWPNAKFINLFNPPYNTSPKGEPFCTADFSQCGKQFGHACVPGPINTNVIYLVNCITSDGQECYDLENNIQKQIIR